MTLSAYTTRTLSYVEDWSWPELEVSASEADLFACAESKGCNLIFVLSGTGRRRFFHRGQELDYRRANAIVGGGLSDLLCVEAL